MSVWCVGGGVGAATLLHRFFDVLFISNWNFFTVAGPCGGFILVIDYVRISCRLHWSVRRGSLLSSAI